MAEILFSLVIRRFKLIKIISHVRRSFFSRINLFCLAMLSCLLATNATGQVTNLSILNIEATQAIQCLDQTDGFTSCPDNSLELTTGRPVAVRVYVGHDGAQCSKPFQIGQGNQWKVLENVTVKLRSIACHQTEGVCPEGHIPDEKTVTIDLPCSMKLSDLRDDKRGSANFILSPDRLGNPNKENILWLEAEVIAPFQEANLDDNNMVIQLGGKDSSGNELRGGLFPRDTLRISYVPVIYRPNTSKEYDPYTGPSLLSDFQKPGRVAKLMKQLYPKPVEFSLWPWSFFLWGSLPESDITCDNCPDVRDSGAGSLLQNRLRESVELMKALTGLPNDYVVGYLPDEATPGCRGVGGPPAAWVSGGCGDIGEGEVLAHEIGHTQNIGHIGANEGWIENCWPFGEGVTVIKEAGFDMSKEEAIRADSAALMRASTWISAYTWNKLIGKQFSEEWAKSECVSKSSGAAAFSAPVEKRNPVAGQFMTLSSGQQLAILISGSISDDNSELSGELDPLYQFMGLSPLPGYNGSGEYCIDFQTDDGSTTFATHCFELPNVSYANGEVGLIKYFSFVLPFPSGTQLIVLRKNSIELDMRQASDNAPSFTEISLDSNEDPTAISWNAFDIDNDNLNFALLYSPDGGSSFVPIAVNMGGNGSLEINSGLLPGSGNAKFRILATDGFNTAVIDSESFEVTSKAPIVVIYTPANDVTIDSTKDLVLSGFAEDMEDGELSGSSLIWTSDLDGELGIGKEIVISGQTLSYGVHHITLTATDSDNQSATAEVIVSLLMPVRFDIKPDNFLNCINVKKQGVTPAAILGSSDFDITNINVGTIKLEGLPPIRSSIEDVNGDGMLDLALKFSTPDMNSAGLLVDGKTLYVTGELSDKVPFHGSDDVFLVKGPSCFE